MTAAAADGAGGIRDTAVQHGLPGIDAVVPVGVHQMWRERVGGTIWRTLQYDPPGALTDPRTRADVEVCVTERRDGIWWPLMDTRRTVSQQWLREHCSYLPPEEPERRDDGGRLDRMRRAVEELARHAGPAGADALAEVHDALADLDSHLQAEIRRGRDRARQAARAGFQRGRGRPSPPVSPGPGSGIELMERLT
ncbi:hypothetical protein [Streptomyces syringium]|uniref:hypothetical protein n=1 Tax=Streptomyces syringium TaxID=76729 RepID=UPI003AAB1623